MVGFTNSRGRLETWIQLNTESNHRHVHTETLRTKPIMHLNGTQPKRNLLWSAKHENVKTEINFLSLIGWMETPQKLIAAAISRTSCSYERWSRSTSFSRKKKPQPSNNIEDYVQMFTIKSKPKTSSVIKISYNMPNPPHAPSSIINGMHKKRQSSFVG